MRAGRLARVRRGGEDVRLVPAAEGRRRHALAGQRERQKAGPAAVSAMPSPLPPSRSIVSSRLMTLFGVSRNSVIAVAAGDRRGDEVLTLQSGWAASQSRTASATAARFRIAQEPVLGDRLASGLELRLDQEHTGRAGLGQFEGRRQGQPQGDEADVRDEQIERCGHRYPRGPGRGRSGPSIGVTRGSAAMRGCIWPWPTSMETTWAAAAAQQRFGEAAGRGAEIEAVRPSTGIANSSSAASSFSPARET